jgi:nitronate monooxygenase
MVSLQTRFTRQIGIDVPIICGAMYPCSNPELVVAASAAGAVGVVQPMSLVFVFRHDFRKGLEAIMRSAGRPIGLNLILERSSRTYEERSRRWLDEALEVGVRFFITALGNPRWVIERVHAAGGIVYHDVTTRGWAEKALTAGIDGLICVNSRAGGHAGEHPPEVLVDELGSFGVPLICAGGVGSREEFVRMIELGYDGVQMGTRFIATSECRVHPDYKRAIVEARREDIVLTERLTGVPCAIIRTPYVDKVGTRAGWLARHMLRGRRSKHLIRTLYSLQSIWKLKQAALRGSDYERFWQAGQSVGDIHEVQSVGAIVADFAEGLAATRAAKEAAHEPGVREAPPTTVAP